MKTTIPDRNVVIENCKEIEIALDANECADAVPVAEIHITNHERGSRNKGKKAKFFVDVRVFQGRPVVLVRAFTPSGTKKAPKSRCTGSFVINVQDAHTDDMSAKTAAFKAATAIDQTGAQLMQSEHLDRELDEDAAIDQKHEGAQLVGNLKFHVGDPCPDCGNPLTPANYSRVHCNTCNESYGLSEPDGNDIEDSADAAAQSELDDNNQDYRDSAEQADHDEQLRKFGLQ